MSELTHIDADGEAHMVDVSSKPVQDREAMARGEISLAKSTLDAIEEGSTTKGNVLAVARLAGIMAAKKTADLIPLCHPLSVTHIEADFEIPESRNRIIVTSLVRISAKTGVEMEALTAVSIAVLTIYDMCKAIDKEMIISEVKVTSKTKG
mgnify:FL=1